MLSISSIKGDSGYYSHEDNYYVSGALDSRWMGDGAAQLGLRGDVKNADMDAVRQGILPDGSDLSRWVGEVNKHRAGYDLTFSAPKSVSMMALIGEDKRVLAAHNKAIDVVIREVEKLVSARLTDEGKTDTVLTGNMVAALYNHDTSRNLEPQLHTHALVFNATFAEEKWRALASDTRMNTGFAETLYGNKIAIGNIYRSALRQEVTALGYETVDVGKNGLWEMKDVPTQVFSSRSQEISEAAGPHASAKSRDAAALDTRQRKAWADPDLLVARWRSRLVEHGFDMDAYLAQAHERATLEDKSAPTEMADVGLAVSETLSALSDKKVQFTHAEILSGVVNRLPALPGVFEQARAGIAQAIDQHRIVPLDRERGLFTADIHLLNELSVHQMAKEALQSQGVLVFPDRGQARDMPASDAVSVLTQDKSPLAIISGRGGAQAQRERMVDVAMMARLQGRPIQVLATDNKSASFLAQAPSLHGAILPRAQLAADTVFPVQSTLIVEQGERLSLKETLLVLEKAQASGTQVVFMDSENRQGTGNALSVLKQADVPQYRAYHAELPSVRIVSEPDKPTRYAQLANEYVQRTGAGQDVVAQVAGPREQHLLTDAIREARREAGALARDSVAIKVLTPVWLDSKTRRQRDSYQSGMVMEQWQAESKSMQRYTIERVVEHSNSLILRDAGGKQVTQRISQLSGSWSLYQPHTLDTAVGDALRVLGREGKGALKAQTRVVVTAVNHDKLTVRAGEKTLSLSTERALKLTHDYVEGIGSSVNGHRTVLAAVSARGLNAAAINHMARSGHDIHLYTPQPEELAQRKITDVPTVRLASEQVTQSTGESDLGRAIAQAREQLMSPAEQAVSLAVPRAQAGDIALSRVKLLAESMTSGVSYSAVNAEITRQIDEGILIPLSSVRGAGNDILVPRVAYEMEKSILRHIAEGKEAVTPLMALSPASSLQGLTQGQREATRMVLESTDRFTAIQGYAGVGKTTQFRAVMSALSMLSDDVRPQVIGLGPTHRAVHEMREAGVNAQTLSSFLSETRQAMQGGETPDFRHVLFLTDESSMVGNRDAAELYQIVSAGGGRMVSSGDTAQLQAISSGQPFRLAQQRSAMDTVVMQEIVRQTPALRPAIERMISGDVRGALTVIEQVHPEQVPRREGAWMPQRSVHEMKTPMSEHSSPSAIPTPPPELMSLLSSPSSFFPEPMTITDAVVRDWMGRTPEAQSQTLIVAHLNADRRDINEAIHRARHERGDIGREEHVLSVLVPIRLPENVLRSASAFDEHIGAVALLNERYYTVASVDVSQGIVTLRDAEGRTALVSPQENTSRDISLFESRPLTLSEGDKVRFTRSDNDRGYVANSVWTVSELHADGRVSFSNGEQIKQLHPQKNIEDSHIDLAYAVTAYGAQGASAPFVISLEGTEGGRKRMVSHESAYVTLSRSKEHVQVYTDNREAWTVLAERQSTAMTAHDVLHQAEDRQALTASRLLSSAVSLDNTALGRRVLIQSGLVGTSMARFVGPGHKYPTPHMALPVWSAHGRDAGALLIDIRLNDEGRHLVLGDAPRLLGGESARFAGVQRSQNGETLQADDFAAALVLAREHPESGVVIRLSGDEPLRHAARLTGGHLVPDAAVERALRDTPDTVSTEDALRALPEAPQREVDCQEAARALAEQKTEILSIAALTSLSDDEKERLTPDEKMRLQDAVTRWEAMDDKTLHEVAQALQATYTRGQLQRSEREWVVADTERDLTLEEKTLGE